MVVKRSDPTLSLPLRGRNFSLSFQERARVRSLVISKINGRLDMKPTEQRRTGMPILPSNKSMIEV